MSFALSASSSAESPQIELSSLLVLRVLL